MNGFCQAPCWPCLVAIMANWWGKNGRVFGLWAACVNIGNIVGGLLAAAIFAAGGWWSTCAPFFLRLSRDCCACDRCDC